MKIAKITSYLNSWGKVSKLHQIELHEIIKATEIYYAEREKTDPREDIISNSSRRSWEKALLSFNWTISEQTYFSPSGRRVNLGSMGPIKNEISAQINFANPAWLHRWLFSQGTLAVRYAGVKIPILITPTRDFIKSMKNQERQFSVLSSYENVRDQLETLAPLSSTFPFLIIGLDRNNNAEEVEILEISSDPNITTEKTVVDRYIEFPPEYYQAGLGILNYFGSFLRENYAEEDAKVKIEQNGFQVRMTIESPNGDTEVIEKALHDYELVISGKIKPEEISQNDKVVLELKTEVRIAQLRLESQQDIIELQNRRIDKLISIIGNSLEKSSSRPITMEMSPTFLNSVSVSTNQDIKEALSDLYELIDSTPPTEEAFTVLNDLTGSLEAIKTEKDPEKIKDSAAIAKLKKLIEKISDTESSVSKTILKIERGYETAKRLIGSYNKIASWCGLPKVPGI